MSNLPKTVDLIVGSDLHLSHVAPISRAEKGSAWYDVMDRYLGQLLDIRKEHNAPCVLAGDIFHRWNSPPELINFSLSYLHGCWTIPGQHDLPYHSLAEIKKSAYWTLVEAGCIHNLTKFQILGKNSVYPFPFGTDIKKPESFFDDESFNRKTAVKGLKIAICHRYAWRQGYSYPNAPEENHVMSLHQQLTGYDVAFFGDNHKGFINQPQGVCVIANCGGFIRRNSDEYNYKPGVMLLYSDGTVERSLFNTKEDRLIKEDKTRQPVKTKEFLSMLKEMDTDDVDFRESLLKLAGTPGAVSPHVRQIIYQLLEELP
jgi:DNA repair exonuclease SbcCD nuclease subunit